MNYLEASVNTSAFTVPDRPCGGEWDNLGTPPSGRATGYAHSSVRGARETPDAAAAESREEVIHCQIFWASASTRPRSSGILDRTIGSRLWKARVHDTFYLTR